ncbi:hypothetical protein [Brucella anthropi]|uniref:hypothetical protein n=1 Tax=Brucella anthropi TaxID=529 RepID=UPI003D965E47
MDHDEAIAGIERIKEPGDKLLQALIENMRERKQLFMEMMIRNDLLTHEKSDRTAKR